MTVKNKKTVCEVFSQTVFLLLLCGFYSTLNKLDDRSNNSCHGADDHQCDKYDAQSCDKLLLFILVHFKILLSRWYLYLVD